MLAAKKIRSLLNGGAEAAGVDGLQAAIEAVMAEIEEHKHALAEIPARRAEAALADDAVAKIAALGVREDELYSAIEVAEIRIAKLRDKLRERVNFGRRDRVAFHRAQVKQKFETLAAAFSAVVAANETALAAFEAAQRELGNDARALVGVGYCELPGLNREMAEHWASNRRRELAATARTAPRMLSLPGDPPPPKPDFKPEMAHAIIPHGPFNHRVALRQDTPMEPRPLNEPRRGVPYIGDAQPSRSDATPSGSRPAKRAARAPLPSEPPAGTKRYRVLKPGYPDAHGVTLGLGDLVDLDEATGYAATANSAVEPIEPQSRPAIEPTFPLPGGDGIAFARRD
jgi:hypothetical protein